MDETTPADLARELGMSDRTIRAYLRERYPDHELNSRWRLTQSEADDVRREFAR